jgi:hypothetical protein
VSAFLTFLIGGSLLAAALVAVDQIGRLWDARQARRQAARRRHPSRLSQRWVALGGPDDGEPLSDEELAEFTGIMMRSSGSDKARETSADEEAE